MPDDPQDVPDRSIEHLQDIPDSFLDLDVRYRCVYCVYGLGSPALSQYLRVFTNFCVSLRDKNTRNVILAGKKKRLRQPGRPHQG